MALGDLIRARRRALRLSQRALAARMGVDPSAVAQWELGTSKISFHRLGALARALETDLQALLAAGDFAGMVVTDPDKAVLIAAWRAVPEDMRPMLLRMVVAIGVGTRGSEAEDRK
jgi:transcriptional regulator with XRE-family HTH domain